jgi:hypothetical protein
VRGVTQEKAEPKNVVVAQTHIDASTPLPTRFFSQDGVKFRMKTTRESLENNRLKVHRRDAAYISYQ